MTTEMFDSDTAQAWDALESALAEWLESVPPDECVILEMPWPEEDDEGTAPYVQLHIDGYDVHSEAASNEVLAPAFHLGADRLQALSDLGWQEPDVAEVTANFAVDEEVPEDAEDLAARLVATLRDVYGVPHPAFLEARGFDDEGPLSADALPFGLRLAVPKAREVDLTAVVASDADALRDLVAEVVERVTGEPAEFDPDGDIPVEAGSTTLYVRVDEQAPCVKLFAALLHGVAWRPRVGHALNNVNQRLRYARVAHQGDHLVVSVQLLALPFVPEHLAQALAAMTEMVDDLAERLQREVGGLRMTDSADEEA